MKGVSSTSSWLNVGQVVCFLFADHSQNLEIASE